METKNCKQCKKHLPISNFYATDTSCKPCRRKKVNEYRQKNIERIKAYDRDRGNLPHRVAGRKEYAKTEDGKKAFKRARQKWLSQNPIKRATHLILEYAVRSGRLDKPKCCSDCGAKGRIHGHHEDYTKPLDVIWLCAMCHAAIHK